MIKKFKKSILVRDSIIYGFTNALFTGLPILLMPLLVAVMSPEDYGKVDLFRSLTMFLVPILGLSTIQSITRYFYDLDEVQFKSFASSIVVFHFFTFVISLVILQVINYFLNSDYFALLCLAIIYFLFNQITEILLSIYRVTRSSKWYMLIRLGSVVFDIGLLTLFYFISKTHDWTYRVLPNIIATLFFGLFSLFLLWRQFGIGFRFDKKMLKTSISYSAPLIFHMLSGYVMNLGDRFAITHYLGIGELGRYSVAYQIGMSVSFFYTSFNLAWLPTFFEWMKKGKYEAINKVKKFVFMGLPILSLIIILIWLAISKFISNLDNYNVDIKIVLIISASYVILSWYKFNSNYFFYYKNTKRLATITTITALVCIVGYMYSIPKYGAIGAALTTLFTFILMFLFVVRVKNITFGNEENI